MEVCGGQTHAIVKFGIDELLPPSVTLVHGPGCPVCVTPLELIDKAIAIAARPDVIFCSFGDMLRVPGRDARPAAREGAGRRRAHRLLAARRRGARARSIPTARSCSSPSASRRRRRPTRWRCTRRARGRRRATSRCWSRTCWCRRRWRRSCRRRTTACRASSPPATSARSWATRSTSRSPRRYRVPIVVTGFEPLDILQGVLHVREAARGGARRGREPVRARGAPRRQSCRRSSSIREVFQVVPRKWRGIGEIPAERARPGDGLSRTSTPSERFGVADQHAPTSRPSASAGCILQGLKKPHECPAFGTRCTPEHPLGATMVSSEGACAAYYRYRRLGRAARGGGAWHDPLPGAGVPGPDRRASRTCCWRTAAAAG